MAWPKKTPGSESTMIAALDEMIDKISEWESQYEDYRDSAEERGNEDAVERHEQILEICQSARDSLEDAKSQLEDWPTAS